MASSAFWKLRRLGPRAVRILQRRKTGSKVIAAYEATLPPKVNAFTGAYDGAVRYKASWRKEQVEGKGAIAALLKGMREWLPLVKRDVPGFNASEYGDKPDVPDDVIEDGSRFAEVVDEHRTAPGSPLPYHDECLAVLEPAVQAAAKEWEEAEAADKHYQELLGKMRATGAEMDTELQAFRRTLAAVGGRRDRAYQKLRAQRAYETDEDDDPTAPAPPSPLPPVPAVGPTPPR
ncbi:MAG: hypothetical protein HY906_28300 [Deltaproteobacteria bacterium]|nr:hypothetical protein [Deltaproteobacteria bacterium]